MNRPSPEKLRSFAPQVQALLAPVKSAGMQCHEGLLLHIQSLYNALENGDYFASRKAFKDVVNCLLGEDDEPTPEVLMGANATAGAVGKLDWSKFGQLLQTLLPVLISLFA